MESRAMKRSERGDTMKRSDNGRADSTRRTVEKKPVRAPSSDSGWIRSYHDIGRGDLALVGGKNASLGELTRLGASLDMSVPDGFVITTSAFHLFLAHNRLEDLITSTLENLQAGRTELQQAGATIREHIDRATLPEELSREIKVAYRELGRRCGMETPDVAVRSSATAEDLPEASFAGLQDTFLNVVGLEDLESAVVRCFGSLYNDRAIHYRMEKGIDTDPRHDRIGLSVGVQKMVHASEGASGVMFTLDTESGFPQVILVNASWGLGEAIVQGLVDPDQFLLFKPSIRQGRDECILERRLGAKAVKMVNGDGAAGGGIRKVETEPAKRTQFSVSSQEVRRLGEWALRIEKHYGTPMDIEWVKDGSTGDLYIVQARPETVHTGTTPELKTYRFDESPPPALLTGVSIGQSIATGTVRIALSREDLGDVHEGDILVTRMTEPDWVPAMKKAAGIITDIGGRTCHAAIVSREFGIPAIVGTHIATQSLEEGQQITLSTAEGEVGSVYPGRLQFSESVRDLSHFEPTHTRIMINLATPETALQWWNHPVDGIGLARMEFIISNHIQCHPMAAVHPDRVETREWEQWKRSNAIDSRDPREFFIEKLSEGIAKIAASQYPKPVLVRTSDFKTNEYARLIGGSSFEPQEENPMLGWRGASRYITPEYREAFALECNALSRAILGLGLTNIRVMIPFCRTPEEAREVIALMKQMGLERGMPLGVRTQDASEERTDSHLQIYMMCEIPSNMILLEDFAPHFDGFSIGSNDLTQLTLGVDRDSARLGALFNEDDPAVKWSIREILRKAAKAGKPVGICGQAPSDIPGFAAFLVENGIDSISVNPDSLFNAHEEVLEAERRVAEAGAGIAPSAEAAVEPTPTHGDGKRIAKTEALQRATFEQMLPEAIQSGVSHDGTRHQPNLKP